MASALDGNKAGNILGDENWRTPRHLVNNPKPLPHKPASGSMDSLNHSRKGQVLAWE
jgi:hypothetical protein